VRAYVLEAPLAKPHGNAAREGLGLRYVKTRLEESFPGRWRVASEAVGAMWRTTIEVFA
jgi:hypothetical protein